MIDPIGFMISWLTIFGIYSILAITLNFESGTSGVTNFGKVFFYGLGAYTTAMLTVYLFLILNGIDVSKTPPYDIKGIIYLGELANKNPLLNMTLLLLSFMLAFMIAGITGYMLSYPIVRVGPAFVGFTLLSTGELFRIFLQHYDPAGGSRGLMSIPNPFAWVPDARTRELLFLLLVLGVLTLTYVTMHRLVNSPLGRTLRAVRDDEVAALCLGKDVPRLKATVLFIGSGFTGIAGSLLAYYMTSVNPDMFVPAVTFNVWAMIILGGMGNLRGALLGSAIFTFFDRALSFITPQLGVTIISPDYVRGFMVGFLIVAVLLYKPQGLLPEGRVETPAWEEQASFNKG
ncbi:MAG: branched-chain amino acid ABC transporter permease [Infirmifilum sp.]|jgi:branched-chain amino acid transport system permease protein|uniref:ABC transporter permease n=1 Tax=Infirmifilum uzonense TaxID=1550241 RepID=A0A0F7FH56_9CREN|nr:branched-chain amino acid ABC transporter permease [Infirmifilum uzonense]AKG38539.1 ABC transporter permease [Infirmifilum uzonense]